MRKLILLLLLLPFSVQALKSVMENYEGLIDFIQRESQEKEPEMIQAANDIKRYESLACKKTCLN
jgi:hypothetical protein